MSYFYSNATAEQDLRYAHNNPSLLSPASAAGNRRALDRRGSAWSCFSGMSNDELAEDANEIGCWMDHDSTDTAYSTALMDACSYPVPLAERRPSYYDSEPPSPRESTPAPMISRESTPVPMISRESTPVPSSPALPSDSDSEPTPLTEVEINKFLYATSAHSFMPGAPWGAQFETAFKLITAPGKYDYPPRLVSSAERWWDELARKRDARYVRRSARLQHGSHPYYGESAAAGSSSSHKAKSGGSSTSQRKAGKSQAQSSPSKKSSQGKTRA